ncbi:hypothetical protein [Saccharopolyspora mangrovi]|uniref:Uncharacterized protein n=1 Tax=Saccharopolyspora mangrovi TaxID=3082379 RepID=A0ABU6AIZ0_9PSEU|nr:hypothetical protein [Saccharopolyspora sp. S2-29]MEB3371354.1 hypothetical protein [Saccharopolyspora sp. S2-29]
MITKKTWFASVAALGCGSCVAVAMLNGFVPGLRDIADPLGRPSQLSSEVIHSASELDRLTSELVPAHEDLGQRMQVLNVLAGNLDGLVGKTGELVPAAGGVNAETAAVGDIARPLPSMIDKVTGRARQAAPQVAELGTAVGSVTTQLENIGSGLTTIQGDLQALGPRAKMISGTLGKIESESARLRPVAPVLSLLRPVTSSDNGSLLPGLLNIGR